MFSDFIMNGQAHGEVAEGLSQVRFDPGMLRPYLHDGRPHCTVNTGRTEYDEKTGADKPVYENVPVSELVASGMNVPVTNATTLRKDEWIKFDQAVIRAARSRLRAWADLAAANSFGGFDGMGKLILEQETMSDPGEAIQDMDGLTPGRTDSPQFQLEGVPLPITHSDFWFSERRLAASRNSGTPLSTHMAEAAGRRVAETVERTTIGTQIGVTYGNSADYGRTPTVYGYTNFPDRITKTDITTPTGANPDATVDDVLAMRDLLYDNNFFGPFMLYTSKDWDRFLDNDYYVLETTGATSPTRTLRERLRIIEGIQDIRRLDFLPGPFQLLMVQMTSEVAQAVIGLNFTTLQWDSSGGMRRNFKVMTIMVPRLQADFYGNCGICHGTTN